MKFAAQISPVLNLFLLQSRFFIPLLFFSLSIFCLLASHFYYILKIFLSLFSCLSVHVLLYSFYLCVSIFMISFKIVLKNKSIMKYPCFFSFNFVPIIFLTDFIFVKFHVHINYV